MKKFFNSITIYKKTICFVLFIFIIFSSIIVSSFFFINQFKEYNDAIVSKLHEAGKISDFIDRLNTFEDIHVGERFDEKNIEKKNNLITEIEALETEILDSETAKLYFSELFQSLKDAVKKIKEADISYTTSLKSLGKSETDGLMGEFRAAIHKIERKFSSDSVINEDLISIRNYEKQYMQTRDQKYLDSYNETFDKLFKDIDAHANCNSNDLQTLNTYKTIFLEYMNSLNTIYKAASEIQKANEAFISKNKTLVDKTYEDIKNEKEKSNKIQNIFKIYSGISFLVIFILILLFIKMIYSVFASIKQMQVTFTQLAENKSDSVIEGVNRQDEIGSLARSLDKIRFTSRKMHEIQTGIESLNTGVVITNADHIITYHNKGFINLIKQCTMCFSSFETNEESQLNTDLSSILTESLFEPELNRYTISRGVYHIEIYVSEIIDNKDKIIGYVYNFTNKSDEKYFQKQLESVVTALLNGDLTQKINTSQISDNFKVISKHFNRVLEIFNTFIDDISLMFDDVSKGTLTTEITRSYEGNFEHIKNNINASIKNLNDIMYKVLLNTKTIHTETKDIILGIDDLSQRTETQASSLQETASAMVELSSAVQNNTENAVNVKEMMAETNKSADNGQNIVKLSIEAMDHIKSSSKEISKIISLIDEIAFQTNLLALNAAVEAARAGDSGKGFAVVAEEVRNLAQRSTEASKQIKKLIDDSTLQVQNGVQLVNESGENFNTILSSIKQVTVLVNDISTASIEQASTLNQINDAITQMDEITQNNAVLVQHSASSMTSLAKYGNNLLALLAQFKIDAQKKTGEK